MTTSAHESAAQFLLAARNRGTPGPRIPAEYRPAQVADAVAVQARVTELVGQPVGGYKCSLPAEPRPIWCAPIFAPAIFRQSPCPVMGSGATAPIEPEIAFVLARDLPARSTPYREEDVRDAVKEARFVLEIIGSRYAESRNPHADRRRERSPTASPTRACSLDPVLSEPWTRSLEAFPITFSTPEGVFATRDGKHPDGHPLRPLVWLANHLAARGKPLHAGMTVTTGSYCGIVDVPLDKPLTVAYGALGSLAVTLTRK